MPPDDDGRLRLLYAVCRPGGRNDVELRTVANRLLQDLGAAPVRLLRPHQTWFEAADRVEWIPQPRVRIGKTLVRRYDAGGSQRKDAETQRETGRCAARLASLNGE